jgi:hypothetical protein
MYSNAYFFCSKCVEMVPPPRAIQSFFCVQNVIDILWNVLYIATTLRPPPSGYPAAGFFWIVFILGVLELICMLAGMFISFAARSELNILLQSGKGSSPVGKTKLSLLFYFIRLWITVGFFCIFWIFAVYFFLALRSSAGDVVAGFIGLIMLVFAIILLPFALIYIGQLVQVCKMREAANHCEGGPKSGA